MKHPATATATATATAMSEVEDIVRQIIKTSPPGDDTNIISDIKSLLGHADADKLISNVLREHYTTELNTDNMKSGDIKLVKLNNSNDYTIISKYNSSGLKFFDTKHGILFDYDFINSKIIDIENKLPSNIDSNSVSFIQNQLNDYINSHFTNLSTGLVIPDENNLGLTFIIIGEKLNDSNFYNGKWISIYKWNSNDNQLSSIVKVKVHYYEDGNVILNTFKTENLGIMDNADNIVQKISDYEKNLELNTLQNVNELNEEKFKNLRRLLPISRSKIQWGRAIGNYKLGQNVVGGRH